MSNKSNKITAVVYSWNTKNCYSGFMSYNDVKRYVNLVKDQSMNRLINDASVDLIIKYMKEEGDGIFFPPVIMNSSGKLKYDHTTYKLLIEQSSLTIIDGQHRIKAINEILEDPDSMNDFDKIKIPFLIIEELSPELHRKLFHTINDKSTKVQNNVSDRFSTTTSNLIGLRYVSEHLENKDMIEWEGKQSKEKIVYSHMLNCIEKIEDFLEEKFKDALEEIDPITVEDKEYYYKDAGYYGVFVAFWDYIFNKIRSNPHDISFYVKEVVLSNIAKHMLAELEDSVMGDWSFTNLIEKMCEILDNLLPDTLIFDYVFRVNKSVDCSESIKDYLKCNKNLNEQNISLNNKQLINKLLSKIIHKSFLNNNGYFSLEKGSIEEFSNYLKVVDESISGYQESGLNQRDMVNLLKEISVESTGNDSLEQAATTLEVN
ncbi:DGQHR domain-containing protein [Paenibacillus amylolyticus]|uniref:DGQHR domain-containing protein n=1 Tax=Paenibacillus TaxID=44249 RepID=UPI0010598AE9|nr:DGQHR domain-containing protein [Paenibacillus amylolyticus]TDL64174.1 DGQHR domain-containing protein [Paenibacillus amylolyticus]